MDAAENRFAHLLQPIRELTKNWDVDVASELNDYLEELDEMCITFDGGKTQLNFAEAALLIQGSTCIYSKKVEMLHNLVYQTLEHIGDQKKRRHKETQSQEDDDAASSNDANEDEALFAPLDMDASETSQKEHTKTTVDVAPLPPKSLIPPETYEKHKLPLISVKGQILCSQKDFRVNLFIPGEEDLILLTLRSAAAGLRSENRRPGPVLQPQADAEAAVDAAADAEDAQNFMPLEDDHMEQEPEEHVDRHQAPRDVRLVQERRRAEPPRDGATPREEAPPTVNVWRLHDLYAVVGTDKPLKPGKCYKVPDGLDDGGKRKRKRPTSLQDFRSWFRGTFDPPEHKLKNGPTFTDLNYIYLTTVKNKLKTRRRMYRKAGLVVSEEDIRKTFLQPEEPQQQEDAEDWRHPDPLGGDDENSDNEHEAFPDDVPVGFGGEDFISAEHRTDELSYEGLVKLRVDQLVGNCHGYTQETVLSRGVKDWEDKIRPELVLKEESPVFDIHDYGDRLVGALSAVGRRRAFSSVVHGLENVDACRYLLASLQLANNYVVEIDRVQGLEESVDSMGLTLLSTSRTTDRFKALTASTSR